VTYGPSFASEDVPDDPHAAQEQWWAGLAEVAGQLDVAEAATDRAPLRRYLSLDGAPIFSLASLDVAVEGVERAAALGFTDVVVHWPRAEGVYAGAERTLEAFADRLPSLQALAPAGRA
jgi:hypothetical protein